MLKKQDKDDIHVKVKLNIRSLSTAYLGYNFLVQKKDVWIDGFV